MGNTRQRAEILRIIKDYHGHPTADDVFGIAVQTIPSIGKGTVYRNLNILADTGQIMRVQMPNEPVRFDKEPTSHEHILCVKCGELIDFKAADLNLKQMVPEDVMVLHHNLLVYGVCPECLQGFQRPHLP